MGFLSERRYRIYLTTLFGVFLTIVDATASFIAVPTIAGDFGVGLPLAQWVLLGYLLTVTALLVPIGRLGDLFGQRKMYIAGFAVGAIGAVVAGLSTHILVLIVARVVMGLGAAMIQATSMAIIVSVFPPTARGKVLGGQMAAVGMGTVLGPVLGGLIITEFGWRSIYLSLGLAFLVVVVLASRVLPSDAKQHDQQRASFDFPGAFLSMFFLMVLLLALSTGPRIGWTHPLVLISAPLCAVLAIGFIVWEKRATDPMLDLALFRNPAFTLGLLSALLAFTGTASAYFLVPFYVQYVLGAAPAVLGLMLMPAGVVTALLSPLMGHVADRLGHRTVAAGGLCMVGIALGFLSLITIDGSASWVVGTMMLFAVGLASFHAPNSSAILATVKSDAYGVASGVINLARNAGNIVGIGASTAIVTGTMAARGYSPTLSTVSAGGDAGLLLSFVDGLGRAMLVLASVCLALIMVLVAQSLQRRKPGVVQSRD